MNEQRMCSVALRHLSGIQKGIQSAHAIVEYQLKFGNTAGYQRWAKKDKTLYVLEAHTDSMLDEAYEDLKKLKVPVVRFKEPDMGNITTAITFLLDQTTWDTKTFPYGDSPQDIKIRQVKNRFQLATN